MAGPALVSGQRRPHDLQQELEFLFSKSRLPVVVVSVDVALDAERCDLSKPAAIAFGVSAIFSGIVIAVVAAPVLHLLGRKEA